MAVEATKKRRWRNRLGAAYFLLGAALSIVFIWHDLSIAVGLIFDSIVSDEALNQIGWLAWSPDGEQIAFERHILSIGGVMDQAIYVVDADGQAIPRPVQAVTVEGWERHSVGYGERLPSPDGRRAAAVSWVDDSDLGQFLSGEVEIDVMDGDGRSARRVYPLVTVTALSCPPDTGDVVAVIANESGDPVNVEVEVIPMFWSEPSQRIVIGPPLRRAVTIGPHGEYTASWAVRPGSGTSDVWVSVVDDPFYLSGRHCYLSTDTLGFITKLLHVLAWSVMLVGAALLIPGLWERRVYKRAVVMMVLIVLVVLAVSLGSWIVIRF